MDDLNNVMCASQRKFRVVWEHIVLRGIGRRGFLEEGLSRLSAEAKKELDKRRQRRGRFAKH